MPTGARAALAAALLAAALLAAAHAAAAPESRPPDAAFGEVLDVQLVNLEVWVTDRKGRPVTGLAAEDFQVLEDGEPVAVTHFAEVAGGEPVAPDGEAAPAAGAEEAPAVAEGEPAPRAPAVEPGHLVVYFDLLHLLPSSRNRVVEDLREFLAAEKVPPERVLVLAQEEGLATEATFGSTRTEIDAALARIAASAPDGGRVEGEKRLAIRRLQDRWRWAAERTASGQGATVSAVEAQCEFFLLGAVPEVEAYAAQSRQRIATTLDHLASVASFLTGVPGVKTLLFVSDALERSPGSDLMAFVNDLCPAQESRPLFIVSDELSRAFRELTRHANANRVTIYSLQALGLRASFMGSAEQAAADFRGARSFDLALRSNERDGLAILATETGGRTVFNRNRFDAELAAVAREMVGYYSLAYEPPHGGDGREHRIEVRVAGRGLEVRHRRGYRDKSPDVRMTERLQGAVYLGLVDNPLGVRLGAGTLTPGERDRMRLPLHVMVPAERITFLPDEESAVARLSVQVSTRETRSLRGIFDQRSFRVRRSAGAPGELVDLVMHLELPEGVHLVAVGLRDDATREASFVSTTLEIHPAADAGR